MTAKGNRRKRELDARAKRRALKLERMKRTGGVSDYAKKKREQANGTFRPTSPFERA